MNNKTELTKVAEYLINRLCGIVGDDTELLRFEMMTSLEIVFFEGYNKGRDDAFRQARQTANLSKFNGIGDINNG